MIYKLNKKLFYRITFPISKRELINKMKDELPYELIRAISRLPQAGFLDFENLNQSIFQYNLIIKKLDEPLTRKYDFKCLVQKEY